MIISSLRLSNHGIANPTEDAIFIANAVAWASLELNYSLISATIPVLRPFISNLSTSFGVGHSSSGNGYGGYSTGSNAQTSGQQHQVKTTEFEMASLKRITRKTWESETAERNDGVCFSNAQATGRASTSQHANGGPPGEDGISVGSNDSQKLIIRKDVSWEVK